MKLHTLLLTALLALAPLCASQAACKHYKVDGLFYRLACKHMKAELTDKEIIGGFWQDLKDLKDAAYRDNLQGFASAHDAPWALQYGTADDVWAALNASDYRQRDVLREVVKQMRVRKPQNPCALLRCKASEVFGYGILAGDCGCGP